VVRECLIGPACKDKKSAKLSQLTAFVMKARTQCWLVLRLPGGLVRGLHHHNWHLSDKLRYVG